MYTKHIFRVFLQFRYWSGNEKFPQFSEITLKNVFSFQGNRRKHSYQNHRPETSNSTNLHQNSKDEVPNTNWSNLDFIPTSVEKLPRNPSHFSMEGVQPTHKNCKELVPPKKDVILKNVPSLDRTKRLRLEILTSHNPNGIFCAELPKFYYDKYKMELKYQELGFNSVRELALDHPEIFHCVQPKNKEDFILYYAKKRLPHFHENGSNRIPDELVNKRIISVESLNLDFCN